MDCDGAFKQYLLISQISCNAPQSVNSTESSYQVMMNDDIKKIGNLLQQPVSHNISGGDPKNTLKDTISSMVDSEDTMDNSEQRNFVDESAQYKLTNYHQDDSVIY